MNFRVLEPSSPDWLRLWSAWPGREVSAHPAFARLFARPGDRVVCAAGEDAGGAVLFPLILRPLAAEPWAPKGESRFDAVTPYGYGGPYAWGTRDDGAYWKAFSAWCAQSRVVSTFARLSLFPEQLAALPEPAVPLLTNVVVPLAGGPDAIWAGYESKVRKWVKANEAAGYSVEADHAGARLEDFYAIYTETMTRRGATDWYFFPREFFRAIVEGLPGQFAFFFALKGGKPVSADLMLLSADYVYYFLGGTYEDALEESPNYLLKHRIALWAAEQGKKGYVLGGGYAEGDGLYRYKRAFAKAGEVPFKAARLVHDEAAVRELTAARAAHEAKGGKAWTPDPRYFPPYRG